MSTSRYKEPQRGPKKHRMIANWIDRTYFYMQNRQFNGFQDWERYIRKYRGMQYSASLGRQRNPMADTANETIVYNEIGTIIQIMLPFLLKNMLKIHVKPTSVDSVVPAILQEALANYCWREYAMQEQLRNAVLYATITGNAFWKNTYKLSYDDTKTGYGNLNYCDFIKEDAPYSYCIPPTCFIFDMDSPHQSLDSARRCCEIQYVNPGDVIGNNDYNQQDVINDIDGKKVKPGSVNSFLKTGTQVSGKFDEYDVAEDERWVLFDYWDKKYDEHIVYLKDVEDPIHIEKNPFKNILEGFPYKHLKLIEVPYDPYGLGYPAWIEDPCNELNRHATKTYQHRRRHLGGQYNYVDMAPEEIIKHQRGESVSTSNPNAILPIPVAPMPPDDWRILEQTRQAIRDYTPVNELMKSGMLQDRASARQAGIAQQNSTIRVDYVAGKVDDFVVSNVRQIIQLLKSFWSAERVIEIVGAQGKYWGEMTGNAPVGPPGQERYFAHFSRENIQGETEAEIETTSGERYDPIVERQQRITIMQAAAGLAQPLMQEGKQLVVSELLKWVLEPFDKKDIGSWFAPANEIITPMSQTEPQPSMGGMQNIQNQIPNSNSGDQQVNQESQVQPASNLLGQLMGGLTVPQQ